MCDQCVEIAKKIAHYERLASSFTDQALLDGIKKLIEQATAQKATLHPSSNGGKAPAPL
jgi:hypothetical protein